MCVCVCLLCGVQSQPTDIHHIVKLKSQLMYNGANNMLRWNDKLQTHILNARRNTQSAFHWGYYSFNANWIGIYFPNQLVYCLLYKWVCFSLFTLTHSLFSVPHPCLRRSAKQFYHQCIELGQILYTFLPPTLNVYDVLPTCVILLIRSLTSSAAVAWNIHRNHSRETWQTHRQHRCV